MLVNSGKVTLITRYGHEKINDYLPKHIEAVKACGQKVVWCCDPMHGNTETVGNVKTRRFTNVISEMIQAFEIHIRYGSKLSGVHLELTGEKVTETIGGSMKIDEYDIQGENYKTNCDPRLNYEQAMDVAFKIASLKM
jgi:3-deoxy-7-phosphoheptulonate synthase